MEPVLSFFIYSFVFGITIIICAVNQPYFEKNLTVNENRLSSGNRITFRLILTIIMASIPVVFIAAFRSDTVGADTQNYIEMLHMVKQVDHFWDGYKDLRIEFLFYFLLFGVSHLFYNIHLFLGLCQFLVFLPILIIAFKKSREFPVWNVIAVYFLLFFNDSLNNTRQCIAAGFLILAYIYFEEKNKKLTITAYLIAFGFHSSSGIIGLFLLAGGRLFRKKGLKVRWIAIFIVLLVLFIYMKNIALFLIQSGILPQRYYYYIEVFFFHSKKSEWVMQDIGMGVVFESLVRIALAITFIFPVHKIKNNSYTSMTCLAAMIYVMSVLLWKTSYGIRFSLYFEYFYLLLLPQLHHASKIRIKGPVFGKYSGEMMVLFFYWMIHIFVLQSSGSVPYTFSF